MDDKSEDRVWIQRLIQGDRKAISYFVDTYGGFIYNVTYKILLNSHEAQEATQDSILKVLKGLSNYNQTSPLKAWCYTIAYRTAIDYKRKVKYTADISDQFDLAHDSTADGSLYADETSSTISMLLSHLDEESRMIISLFYLEEKNIKELMEITGLTESNIKIKLYRSRKLLGQHAGKYFEHS
ncbi:MAG: sigma-70 family RNA polymerase sigma factor [Saprospiraceae bacterium]